MDKLDCMRAFRQVVDSRGYAAAAREIGTTRSTVSKQVAYLEKLLQTQLLVRSTRQVRPTESGLAFYDRCQIVLGDFDEAVSAVTQLRDTPGGKLRINAPMSFGTMHLSAVVADFMTLYESVHVELSLADRLVDPIEEGFDITIRIAVPHVSTSLVSREIACVQRRLCASPEYIGRHGEPVHPGDLIAHRCLHYGYLASGNYWQLTGPGGELSVPVNCTMWSNNGEVLRDAAIRGCGIVVLPGFIADVPLAQGELVEVLDGYKPRDIVISAVYPRHRHLSLKVQRFVQFVVDRLGFLSGAARA